MFGCELNSILKEFQGIHDFEENMVDNFKYFITIIIHATTFEIA